MSGGETIDSATSEIELILLAEIGLDVTTVGSSLVQRAVQRRMQKLGVGAIATYIAMLSATAQELQELVEEVVVPETYFFREPEGIADVVARAIATPSLHHADAPLRILSVPCSSGEEPYSIAMSLLSAGLSPDAMAIDAVDVSVEAVRRAKEGIYRSGSFRGEIGAWKKYFSETGRGLVIDDLVRSCVRVEQGNLMSATFQPPRATYDVIFCRNLLIYFDANTQTRALAMLASLLAPGGVLVVGAADSFAARRAGFAPAPGYERSFLFRLESATREGDAPSVPTARARRLTLARPLVKPLVKTLPLRAQSRKPVAPRIEPKPRSFETSDGPAEKRALVDVARLADEGRLAEALSVGEAALRDGFVTAALLSLLGTTHAALPDLESAESCYRRALFLEPDNEDALLHLALLLEKRGETELANRYHARAKRALGRPALAMP